MNIEYVFLSYFNTANIGCLEVALAAYSNEGLSMPNFHSNIDFTRGISDIIRTWNRR